MNSSLRRSCIIVFILLACMSLPVAGKAQNTSPFLSWDELAAHAGLAGISAKNKDQFRCDVCFVSARNISVVKASILLTPAEWSFFNSSIPNHLLHPWDLGKLDTDMWKHMVYIGLPFEGTVNVDRLKDGDKYTILRRPDLHSIRLYMLSPNADGKSGVLFYFYNKD
ncbi:hypothetical protein [Prosthecobacter vanneervenii]|uniref:Uncharacterized protein n=1 Tax=Prosthecobacter vanneervenii TaxID=48466 RepID=A0A7W8DNA4_9BACT|nr:hypothetical protein [Prosthecobacter vanneervenii]MBB5035706.1 hypothetical protein [Prosthecobacter vanneervenii]